MHNRCFSHYCNVRILPGHRAESQPSLCYCHFYFPSAVPVLTVTVWKTNKALRKAARARKEQSLHPISQGSITWRVSYRISTEFNLLVDRGLHLLLGAHTQQCIYRLITLAIVFFLNWLHSACVVKTHFFESQMLGCVFMYYAEPPECVDAPGENMCSSTFLNSSVFKNSLSSVKISHKEDV